MADNKSGVATRIAIGVIIGGAVIIAAIAGVAYLARDDRTVAAPAEKSAPRPANAKPSQQKTAVELAAQRRAADIGAGDFCFRLGQSLRAKREDGPFRVAMIDRALGPEWNVRSADFASIAARGVEIGMNTCAVLAAIGRADRVNRTVRSGSEHYQLVYESPRRYVYLDNGIVTSYQD